MPSQSDVERTIPGLNQFLRDARKLGPEFQREMRKGSVAVADYVVKKARANASTQQERLVAQGLEARPDRIPKIRVSSSRTYVSASRPNRKRRTAAKVKVIDAFFGVEFGGGKYGRGNPTPRKSYADGSTKGGGYTTQFRPHKGRTGYFFYPTVRSEGPTIERLYGEAVQQVLEDLGKG
jgi:hypothetical protein